MVYRQPVTNQLARSAIIIDDPYALLPFLAGSPASNTFKLRCGNTVACNHSPRILSLEGRSVNWSGALQGGVMSAMSSVPTLAADSAAGQR